MRGWKLPHISSLTIINANIDLNKSRIMSLKKLYYL